MCKKAGMPERKYRLHISENYFGKRSDQKSIKEGLGEILGIGTLLSISTRNMKINGEGNWSLSRNIIRYYLVWPSAWVHVVILRISRISASGNKINMGPLEAIYLSVIMIPPSLLTSSDTKEEILLKKKIWEYNKMLFSMAKRLGSRCELKNIKNICIRE